jgi:transposase
MTYSIGIDVGKAALDVCVLSDGQPLGQGRFDNDVAGIRALVRWLKKQGIKTAQVCLEATGIYSDALAEQLHERGYAVSVVNPARISAYAASQLRRNKTDALDAGVIADFCHTQQPPVWTPPAPELRELRALVRHLDDLKAEVQRVKNRLEAQRSALAVIAHLQTQLGLLQAQIAETEALIRQHVNQHPVLKQQRDLLKTIPGIGHLTACRLLAELGDVRRFDDVRQLVAFVGLNPRQHQSGRKHTTHGISRMGRASLRAALFMPAVVAKRCNPRLKTWAQHLAQRGLTGKQVIVALMRKLIHLTYGILKSGRAFDPHHADRLPVAA